MYCIHVIDDNHKTLYLERVYKGKCAWTEDESKARSYTTIHAARKAIDNLSESTQFSYFYIQLKGVRAKPGD